MPSQANAVQVIYEQTGVTVMARIRNNAGAYITQASLSSITCNVFSLQGGVKQVGSPAVTISATVFNTLQTNANDPRWTLDNVGYDFAFSIPASFFATAGQYRAEFLFQPISGDQFAIVAPIAAQRLLSYSA